MIPILIPVYKPEKAFSTFVSSLAHEITAIQEDCPIVIVNDGNDKDIRAFKEIEGVPVHIVHHAVNLGKGRALKTGLNFILNQFTHNLIGCVTCDADGQHIPKDIIETVKTLKEHPDSLILGCREFKRNVPLRSKLGNSFTRCVFSMLTGMNVSDTQTGLRGIPESFMKVCITLEGEQYEFEMNMLLETKKRNINIVEHKIQTVYLDKNSSSHFNPLLDSIKIYRLIFKFSLSSGFSSLVDFCIFTLVYFLLGRLLISMLAARACSLLINFTINHEIVFKPNSSNKFSMFAKYMLLASFLFTTSYFSIRFLCTITSIPVCALKVIVDSILFVISYWFQNKVVFK